MGLFSALVKTAIEVVALPVAVVKDYATLGGELTDQHDAYTVQKLKDIKKAAQDDIEL